MELLYEIWLHEVCDFEPELAAKMAPVFEKPVHSFSSSDKERELLKEIGVSGEFAERMSNPEIFERAKATIKYCEDNGIRIITMDSEEYPARLKEINTPPRILFAKGAYLSIDNEVGVSVVGARKCTDHGKTFARLIGRSLARHNIVVISGMAEGIDAEAHKGALDEEGKTIAVLAGSVDHIYPKCNERLYRQILEKGGTILSERPPKTPVKRYFYQQRNRIITGLSLGAVIVEGEEHSGTSISARVALEDNKDIFAVPGNPMQAMSKLPNRLIDEGAIFVKNADIPAYHYKERFPNLVFERTSKNTPAKKTEHLLTEDQKILKFLKENGGVARADQLAESLGINLGVLSGRLTILCIKGKIRQESGNRYVLCE